MLTEAWTKLRYHPEQTKLWRTKARFVGAFAGRGSGKTELARRRIVRYLAVKKPWPDPMYFYALPTYNQARRVAWNKIKALVPEDWLAKEPSESGMVINTVFGSSLYVVGMDKPQRIEGDQWDGGVIDESSDQKPGVFDRNVLPALSHREAWCWRIGVPKRYGVGAREFKKFCDDMAEEVYTWPSSDILTPEQIAYAMENLDAKDYNEQYNASWEEVAGLIFHAFSGIHNVSDRVCYHSDRPLVVGSDFNVDPMCWVIGHRADNGLTIHDELFVRNCNTREALNRLYKKYSDHPSGFEFFGDASGRARKTSASLSDYLQIRNDDRFKGRKIFYPKANPPVADRFASCNALFESADGRRRFFVHPRCKHLIEDLEDRAYKEGTNDADDYGDIGHMSDAVGYIIHRCFPIRAVIRDASPEVYYESLAT